MNAPRSDRHAGGKPRPEEKKRADIETPEEETYAHGETRPEDEGYVGTTPPYRSDADRTIGAAGHTVKTGIVSSLRGIDGIESDIVSLVRNTVSNTLRATGAVGTEADNTVLQSFDSAFWTNHRSSIEQAAMSADRR